MKEVVIFTLYVLVVALRHRPLRGVGVLRLEPHRGPPLRSAALPVHNRSHLWDDLYIRTHRRNLEGPPEAPLGERYVRMTRKKTNPMPPHVRGRLGGLARARNLSDEAKVAIARMGAAAFYEKYGEEGLERMRQGLPISAPTEKRLNRAADRAD